MSQKRLDYLDMAKGVGIFLVVLGHIEYIQESTLKWIFSFHMPLFFVVGGVLAFVKAEREKPAGEVLRRKAQGTLVPYISFSLILLTMNLLDFFVFPKRITEQAFVRQLVDTVTGYGIHILWFLPAYFLANAVFFLLDKLPAKRSLIRNCLILALAAAAFGISRYFGLENYTVMEGSLGWYAGMNLLITCLRGILALPFVLLGWYLANWEDKLSGRMCWVLSLLLIPGGILAFKTPAFDLHYLHIQPLHYLAAACSCTGLLFLLRALPVSRVLSYLGRNSLVIMCTHASFFVVYYISLGMFFLKKFIPMTQPVFNVGIAVLVCVAEVPLIWFFNHYGKHLLGRTV